MQAVTRFKKQLIFGLNLIQILKKNKIMSFISKILKYRTDSVRQAKSTASQTDEVPICERLEFLTHVRIGDFTNCDN